MIPALFWQFKHRSHANLVNKKITTGNTQTKKHYFKLYGSRLEPAYWQRWPHMGPEARCAPLPHKPTANSFVATDGEVGPCFKSGHPTALVPYSLQILEPPLLIGQQWGHSISTVIIHYCANILYCKWNELFLPLPFKSRPVFTNPSGWKEINHK